jgi:hypothetical protein
MKDTMDAGTVMEHTSQGNRENSNFSPAQQTVVLAEMRQPPPPNGAMAADQQEHIPQLERQLRSKT